MRAVGLVARLQKDSRRRRAALRSPATGIAADLSNDAGLRLWTWPRTLPRPAGALPTGMRVTSRLSGVADDEHFRPRLALRRASRAGFQRALSVTSTDSNGHPR